MVDTKGCRQCGTCCRKGGPALHRQDRELIGQGHIPLNRLLTIRRGELGHNPATGKLEPVPVELIKIIGRAGSWTCCFLVEERNTCGIYQHRPSTCRILECRQPEALLATIYRDTLIRAELLAPDDPILTEIEAHEQACPGGVFSTTLIRAAGGDSEALDQLATQVRADLALRTRIARQTGISVDLEYFLFGRPFFRQLAGAGLEYQERSGEVRKKRIEP